MAEQQATAQQQQLPPSTEPQRIPQAVEMRRIESVTTVSHKILSSHAEQATARLSKAKGPEATQIRAHEPVTKALEFYQYAQNLPEGMYTQGIILGGKELRVHIKQENGGTSVQHSAQAGSESVVISEIQGKQGNNLICRCAVSTPDGTSYQTYNLPVQAVLDAHFLAAEDVLTGPDAANEETHLTPGQKALLKTYAQILRQGESAVQDDAVDSQIATAAKESHMLTKDVLKKFVTRYAPDQAQAIINSLSDGDLVTPADVDQTFGAMGFTVERMIQKAQTIVADIPNVKKRIDNLQSQLEVYASETDENKLVKVKDESGNEVEKSIKDVREGLTTQIKAEQTKQAELVKTAQAAQAAAELIQEMGEENLRAAFRDLAAGGLPAEVADVAIQTMESGDFNALKKKLQEIAEDNPAAQKLLGFIENFGPKGLAIGGGIILLALIMSLKGSQQ